MTQFDPTQHSLDGLFRDAHPFRADSLPLALSRSKQPSDVSNVGEITDAGSNPPNEARFFDSELAFITSQVRPPESGDQPALQEILMIAPQVDSIISLDSNGFPVRWSYRWFAVRPIEPISNPPAWELDPNGPTMATPGWPSLAFNAIEYGHLDHNGDGITEVLHGQPVLLTDGTQIRLRAISNPATEPLPAVIHRSLTDQNVVVALTFYAVNSTIVICPPPP